MNNDQSGGPALLLEGLDAGNPLAFLALLGTMQVASRFAPRANVHWRATGNGWRPVIGGHGADRSSFVEALTSTVATVGGAPFDIDAKLPFDRNRFGVALRAAVAVATPNDRRGVDLLAGLGSDAWADEAGNFEDTALRLVRSGDSSGQGFLHYVAAARTGLHTHQVDAMLFSPWRYSDDCFSLRWDPVEDQRYALRAGDPSKGNKRIGSLGVKAANAIGAEGMALLPVQPQAHGVATTGFAAPGELRQVALTWPIWNKPCGIDVVRSVLAHRELTLASPNSQVLRALGVVQVYRSDRISQSKYYKNFAPARPV